MQNDTFCYTELVLTGRKFTRKSEKLLQPGIVLLFRKVVSKLFGSLNFRKMLIHIASI